jgi:hypothetical protein
MTSVNIFISNRRFYHRKADCDDAYDDFVRISVDSGSIVRPLRLLDGSGQCGGSRPWESRFGLISSSMTTVGNAEVV